jgi:DNA polymerase I-like protein with 3'-5' exonuclease and polymerase domains
MTHQINFVFKESDWKTPTSFPNLKEAKEIAIDLETKDPNIKNKGPGWPTNDGNIIGVSVAAEGFNGYYPIAHESGSNMDYKTVLDWVQEICNGPGDKIFHNAHYDVGWLRAHGIRIKQGRIIDTMIASALVDENRFSYSLNALAYDWLGETKSEKELRDSAAEWGVDAKGEMYKLPAQYVGFYAEQDSALTLKLWQYLKIKIEKESLKDIFELECDVFHVLHEMMAKGIKVDLDQAHQLKKEFIAREKQLLFEIKQEAGVDIDIFAARSIAKAFDKLKIKYPLTEKSKEPSFTANWLLNCEHKIAKLIREARETHKFHATFIDSVFKFTHNGRIHASINQLRGEGGGTVSGRLSYNNPNLQQIPARNLEFGPKIRSLFKPDNGMQWGSFDYSQQEPRIVVHYAVSIGYEGAGELLKAYQKEDADFHQTVAEMADIPRTQAKTINLGLFYGMGVKKLARELGISQEDADQILNKYNTRVPFVKQLARRCMDSAEKYGSVRTLKGRRCRFDLWEPQAWGLHKAVPYDQAVEKYGKNAIKRSGTFKSLNRLIQGSAADQVKVAMVQCFKNGFLPLLQIHDELCFNVRPGDKDIGDIKHIMENCIKELKVPSKVDVETGASWGECKKL